MSRRLPIDDLAPGMFIVCERVAESEAGARGSRGRSVIRIGGKQRVPEGWPMEVLVSSLPFVAVRRVPGQGVSERRFPIDVRRYRLHRVDAAYAESLASGRRRPTRKQGEGVRPFCRSEVDASPAEAPSEEGGGRQ